jgi:hydroxyacylglutathione hydrolase
MISSKMKNIKTFVFNPFQVNTYIVSDNIGNAIIIDPACYDKHEEKIISEYIESNSIKIQSVILTHAHIDHILGASYIQNKYNAEVLAHKQSEYFLRQAHDHGMTYGFMNVVSPVVNKYVEDGESIQLGQIMFKVLYTPGHADGSICLFESDSQIVFSGDVLFNSSIGRTDLPTGNLNLLINSIQTKLFTLPENTTVYPGHGAVTSIIQEKTSNPFLS